MKQFFTLLAALMLLSPSEGHTAMTVSGTYNCENSSMFMDMDLKETGYFHGKKSALFALNVRGHAVLEECLAKKEVTLYGTLEAVGTQFTKDVTAFSGQHTLESCDLQNLFILDSPDVPLTIYLKGKTTIHGNVTFQTNTAQIFKGPDVIIGGEIINGQIHNIE